MAFTERGRDRLGIWWWPATWVAGSIVATAALLVTASARPFLYGPAVAAGISASAAGRRRLSGALGGATAWAAIGIVWAALLGAVALTAPGACIDGNGAAIPCTPEDVATWAALGPLVTLAILVGAAVWRIFVRTAGFGAKVGVATARIGRAKLNRVWVLRGFEMLGGAVAAAAIAAIAGGHGGIIITAACAGAAISPIVSPFHTRTTRAERDAEKARQAKRDKKAAQQSKRTDQPDHGPDKAGLAAPTDTRSESGTTRNGVEVPRAAVAAKGGQPKRATARGGEAAKAKKAARVKRTTQAKKVAVAKKLGVNEPPKAKKSGGSSR